VFENSLKKKPEFIYLGVSDVREYKNELKTKPHNTGILQKLVPDDLSVFFGIKIVQVKLPQIICVSDKKLKFKK